MTRRPTRSPGIDGLYVIADTAGLSSIDVIERSSRVLAGGARVLQYRDKTSDQQKRLHEAQHLSDLCKQFNALMIVNDDPELALKVSADGIHAGQHDISVSSLKQHYPQLLIGASCYDSMHRAEQAIEMGADYIAFGSFFPSLTKPDAVQTQPELLTLAKQRFRQPVVAIGGITVANASALIDAGADAIAVISSVFRSQDPFVSSREIAALFSENT